jgi:hypothetical protein
LSEFNQFDITNETLFKQSYGAIKTDLEECQNKPENTALFGKIAES